MNKAKRLAIFVTSLSLIISMTGTAFAQNKVNEDIKLVTELSPNEIEEVNLIENKTSICSKTEHQNIEMDKSDVSKINILTLDEINEYQYEMSVNLPVDKSAETEIIDNNIVTVEDNFSTVTEIGDGEMQINFVIDNKAAPERYVLDYEIPKGAKLQFASLDGYRDGSIEIIDENGNPFCAIAIPWAKDSNGNNVETYYEIIDNKVIQVVKHKSQDVQYPIVADPKNKYSDWFESATWKIRDGKRYLRVVPTNWNRQSGVAYASTSWALLKAKKSGSSYWKNEGGLKNQYYCHTQAAKLKESWNLEPWRPNVSLAKTIAKACNP